MIIKCTQTVWFQERPFENNMGPLVFFLISGGVPMEYYSVTGLWWVFTQIIPVNPKVWRGWLPSPLGLQIGATGWTLRDMIPHWDAPILPLWKIVIPTFFHSVVQINGLNEADAFNDSVKNGSWFNWCALFIHWRAFLWDTVNIEWCALGRTPSTDWSKDP